MIQFKHQLVQSNIYATCPHVRRFVITSSTLQNVSINQKLVVVQFYVSRWLHIWPFYNLNHCKNISGEIIDSSKIFDKVNDKDLFCRWWQWWWMDSNVGLKVRSCSEGK